MSDIRLLPSFVSETVLQNSIFRIFTKRYRPSLILILPIITTLYRFLIFQSIRPDTHFIPKYEYFIVRNFCKKCFSRHITFAEIQKIFLSRWHSWLRHCATNLKIVDSIPDGVAGIDLIIPDPLWPCSQLSL
jgi:hypothetical protein